MQNYELLARRYAEKYGIINYRIQGKTMVFNVSYNAYLSNPRYTVQHTVDLVSGTETTKRLKRFDAKGLENRS